MNIFFINKNPQISARLLCNKHIVKMIAETTQIIATVLSKHNIKFCDIKPTHHNHPSVLWAGLNIANFEWLVEYLHSLHYEYYIRYGKEKNKFHSYFEISKLILFISYLKSLSIKVFLLFILLISNLIVNGLL